MPGSRGRLARLTPAKVKFLPAAPPMDSRLPCSAMHSVPTAIGRNNKTLQNQAVGDLNQRRHISGDDTRQRLPGPRNILNGTFVGFIDEYSTDRRGTDTPLNYSNRQNMAMRGGVTRKLWSGAELTVDGSFRQKHTQSGFFAPYNTLFVVPNDPDAYVASELTTAAITPRLNIDQSFNAFRLRMIAGIDVYK